MMRRGWCPGVYDPMPSGDGLLLRVKPPGARLTAPALRELADAAGRYGNGIIELTRRGYLQIRGLQIGGLQIGGLQIHGWHVRGRAVDGVAAFAAAMVAAGLADADPARERRRRVICAPPFHAGIAARIEAMQAASPDWDRLPDKCAVSVNCLDGDIQVIGPHTFLAGGTLAADVDPVDAVARLAAAALAMGGGRMRALVAAHGEAAIFAAAGLPARDAPRDVVLPTGAFGVAFGHMTVSDLRGLAALADACGGFLLLTPRREVVLDGPDDGGRAAAARLGLLTDPADPRRDVAACAGQPACARATVPARTDAACFAGLAPSLHVSGCAKGCARSAAAAVTLVGRDGQYDLVLNGRADGTPAWRGLTRDAALAVLAAL